MGGEDVCRRVRAVGIVQGVNFRYLARQRARLLGLTGWVRNVPDGSVEAVVCGPVESVDAMVEWMRTGPPAARVDRLEQSEAAAERLASFEIR